MDTFNPSLVAESLTALRVQREGLAERISLLDSGHPDRLDKAALTDRIRQVDGRIAEEQARLDGNTPDGAKPKRGRKVAAADEDESGADGEA